MMLYEMDSFKSAAGVIFWKGFDNNSMNISLSLCPS